MTGATTALRSLGWRGTATYSPCERWRYTLTRTWGVHTGGHVAFVLLNPSTATETRDDPTIRRCMGFAYDWGMDGLWILNIFAWRSTDPLGLLETADPVGVGNDAAIREVLASPSLSAIVCGWGDGKPALRGLIRERSDRVLSMIEGTGQTAYRLGMTTRTGAPRHPLYLRRDTRREPHR